MHTPRYVTKPRFGTPRREMSPDGQAGLYKGRTFVQNHCGTNWGHTIEVRVALQPRAHLRSVSRPFAGVVRHRRRPAVKVTRARHARGSEAASRAVVCIYGAKRRTSEDGTHPIM